MSKSCNNDNDSPGIVLSEYEINRARTIERNNAKLVALGLISKQEEYESNQSAWKRNDGKLRSKRPRSPPCDSVETCHDNNNEENAETTTAKSKSPRKRKVHEISLSIPTRKSLRLQGLSTHETTEGIPITIDELQKQREKRRIECYEARQRAAIEFANQVDSNGKKNTNPTATYEHCLHRVRTMTHAALANRIRVIERAAGKHCIIKMAITASCLKDEGLWELAELASEALERLKELHPPQD
jgi:hypothetical protein